MATDRDNLAGNVRRMAGLHDKSLAEVADAIGMSRAGMAKIVDRDATRRSYPKAETAIKLAELFGVTLNDLYADPTEALLAAVVRAVDAPIDRSETKIKGLGTIKSTSGKRTPAKPRSRQKI
jgi:DNA-binding XRE family transcriptional regulator